MTNMARYICMAAVLYAAVTAAAPPPPRHYQQSAPAHLQNISPLDYYLDGSADAGYYSPQQQKQASEQNGAPSRLENLEPDSEVELIPGAQQPQQPPQQTPVNPNVAGIVPGQRVFIVHMPVPGYRPGSIGGYQPVYIVAAGPQGNNGYATNGYQNAFLLNPSGQGVVSPFLGYPGAQGVAVPQGVGVPQGAQVQGVPQGAGLLLGPSLFNRGYEHAQFYQDPGFAFQQGPIPNGVNGRDAAQFSQLVGFQGHHANGLKPTASSVESANKSEQQRVAEASEESKEAVQEQRRNARPIPPHAQPRNKA